MHAYCTEVVASQENTWPGDSCQESCLPSSALVPGREHEMLDIIADKKLIRSLLKDEEDERDQRVVEHETMFQ